MVPGCAQLGGSSLSADLGKFMAPESLPGRYIGSVSVTEVEQSDYYTCIVGDCILEAINSLLYRFLIVKAWKSKSRK